jgi:hypothetical protein
MSNSIATGVAYADPAIVGYSIGTSGNYQQVNTSSNVNSEYVATSATNGDTRLTYSRLKFTGAGSGETIRAYASITVASSAPAGTINGAHISVGVDGGSVSGAANAIRATLGATTAAPGGTLAAIQADTNFDSGVTLPGSASFIRFTESGTAKMANFFNVPKSMVKAASSVTSGFTLKIIADDGTPYYLLASATA